MEWSVSIFVKPRLPFKCTLIMMKKIKSKPTKYDPTLHHRRSIRLKGYDYSQPGAYYVTIITQGRVRRFGEIVQGEMRLNQAGSMVEKWWLELAHKFPTVVLGAHGIMPNHFHGIIRLVGVD